MNINIILMNIYEKLGKSTLKYEQLYIIFRPCKGKTVQNLLQTGDDEVCFMHIYIYRPSVI